MERELLSQAYQDFIKNNLHQEQHPYSEEYLELCYNLHNIYVNPGRPQHNKHCSSCVSKTVAAVQSYYPTK